ncbi:protein SRC2-like [Punica granatum]|uniref:C2 domain-containing protein n=2 Tax=Punica granatum TaxID=22663 RepID=A0A218WNA0_PUNGR|nr:protein SRC2-like [Punica granatum]OWM74093.1 hypothetical protein CDL15_Pgr008404 [Punica granatum]PKI46476.1 hypothetical protein CRG98_033119 [Punica granatum]
MEYRTLDINVISAKDIKDVNLFSKMDVYVVVSISGDPYNNSQKAKTKVDRDGGKNPAWNCPMKFTIIESAAQEGGLALVFNLRCDRSLGDKDIGEVVVPIKELLSSAKEDEKSMRTVTYQVRKPSGKPKGELHFSYNFGDVVKGQEQPPPPAITAYPAEAGPSAPYKYEVTPPAGYPPVPPTGYPAPPPAGYPPPPAAAGYPPPPPGYGYPPPNGGYPPPPPGYGYPPPPPGYGYQEPKKKNKFGMGLGAGLVGGMVGGLLLGEMASDAADFDVDCGGF